MLVELGSSDYLKRYQTYVSHVQQWRQQFQKLESVSLRYENQVIVNPDLVKPSAEKPNPVKLEHRQNGRIVKSGMTAQPRIVTRGRTPEWPLAKPALSSPTTWIPNRTAAQASVEAVTSKKTQCKSADAKKPATTEVSTKKGQSRRPKKVVAKAAPVASARNRRETNARFGSGVCSALWGSGGTSTPKPSAAIAKPPANTSSN